MFRPELSVATRSEDNAYISITFKIPPRGRWGLLKQTTEVRRIPSGDRGGIRRQIVMICSEYAGLHGGSWDELLQSLFREFVRHAGRDAAQRFFGTLATKSYSKKEREEEVVFYVRGYGSPSSIRTR